MLFALSLKIAHFKERPWAIHSHRSLQKNDHEQFAQVVLYKRAIVSDSLFKKEQCKWFSHDSSKLLAKNERIAFKNSYFSYVLDSFPPFYAQERIAPVALYKRLTMSDSLRSLMTKERREKFALFHEWIAFSLLHSQ